jgi:hypothetical protein
MREWYTTGKKDPSRKERTDEKRRHSSGTRCREQDPKRSLIYNLRQLASSLERSLDNRQEPLPENVHGLIEDMRQLVKRAEKRALTTAFYGQPPRI